MTTVGSTTRKFVFTRLRLSARIYKSIRGATSVRSLALFHNGLVLLSQTPSIPPSLAASLCSSSLRFHLSSSTPSRFHLPLFSSSLSTSPPPFDFFHYVISRNESLSRVLIRSQEMMSAEPALRLYADTRTCISMWCKYIPPQRARLECCWRGRAWLVCVICDVLSDVNKNQLKKKRIQGKIVTHSSAPL